MSKTTITVPTHGTRRKGPGSRQVEGQVALIAVDGKPHKFFIHDGNLTDYRTGYRFGDLNAVKVRRMAQLSTYHRTTDRQAAAILVKQVIAKYGIDRVREQLTKFPTLNP
jgi:hypothetical protein